MAGSSRHRPPQNGVGVAPSEGGGKCPSCKEGHTRASKEARVPLPPVGAVPIPVGDGHPLPLSRSDRGSGPPTTMDTLDDYVVKGSPFLKEGGSPTLKG
jgi:hypothetical protein